MAKEIKVLKANTAPIEDVASLPVESVVEKVEWTHDTMIEALWRSPEKKELSILYEREDKSRYSGQALKDSRKWKDFFIKFTPEQVDQFSEASRLQREIQNKGRGFRVPKEQVAKVEKQKTERRNAADELETLFRAKLEAFEIPEVRDSENRELRSRIRKSKSLTEISALVASLITLSIIRITLRPEGLLDEEPSSNTTTIENSADKEIGDEK
jgi:hypothetical protein|tara:strand:- start:6101 stop:6739 length:639 start_codon:yes stop_codon:yes gene_type:complete